MSMRRSFVLLAVAVFVMLVPSTALSANPQATAVDSKVSVGGPSGHPPQNQVHEPAVAMDAHNPDILVAGASDWIDHQPCPHRTAIEEATCDPDPGFFGVSSAYFSFDR